MPNPQEHTLDQEDLEARDRRAWNIPEPSPRPIDRLSRRSENDLASGRDMTEDEALLDPAA